MSQAEKIVAAPENHLFNDCDPSQTLDNCSAVVRFIGDAADSVQHNAGEMAHGPAISLLCWLVTDALEATKEKLAQGGAQ